MKLQNLPTTLARRALAPLLWLCLLGVAHAWTAIADQPNGEKYFPVQVEYGDDDPGFASQTALDSCNKRLGNGCELLTKHAVGYGAVVVAQGIKGTRHPLRNSYASRSNPLKAAAAALALCRRGGYRCWVTFAVWDGGANWTALAVGKDGLGTFLARNAPTRDQAEQSALAGCKKKGGTDCQIYKKLTTSDHLFFVQAGSKDAHELYVSETRKVAEQKAMAICGEKSSTPCKLKFIAENKAPDPAPSSFARVEREAAQGHKLFIAAVDRSYGQARQTPTASPGRGASCRPQGPNVQCTSQCVNGNCVIQYENGCKVRVQVSPVFNGFNNQWEYPAPSC
jgi:hypothetical protein